MVRLRAKTREIAAVRRAQIIQRILVDGWNPREAATVFGVGERQIARWVAAYRRRGMASLHADAASELPPGRWVRRLRMVAIWVSTGLRGGLGRREPAPCVVLRHRDDASGHRRMT
jgi:Homeodomain-like domain-containing protein